MRTYYVNIDSRDRDRRVWPNANQFQVQFDPAPGFAGAAIQRSFKNVVSVELIHAVVPASANVAADMYVNLHIPELDAAVVETSHGNRCFASILLEAYHTTHLKSVNEGLAKHVKTFSVKGTRIDKMTIEFRDWKGDLIDLGTDASLPSAPTAAVQSSVLLRITVDDQMTI